MGDLIMKHVVPGLGCLVAWALFASPFQAVLAVRGAKALGSLNPLPLVAMWANCVAWLVYSFITVDPYVLASNVPGLLLGSFMAISCYGFADDRTRDRMLQGVMAFAALLTAAGAAVSFGRFDHAGTVNIWGSTTVFILIIFYCAPLSVLAEVLATRSAAALHLPFACMNAVNGLLWSGYGLALGDAFIYGPNMVGAVFGALQVGLCIAYPSKTPDRYKPPPPDDAEMANMLFDAGQQQGRAARGGGGG
ncbi:SWEET6B [Scenedesmus sp. PABB004]|nr:SWEET6B [Scenedesmus sp. PABB004]